MKLRTSALLAAQNLKAKHSAIVSSNQRLALVNVPIGSAFITSNGANIVTSTPQEWVTGTAVKIEFAGTGFPPSISPLTIENPYWLIRMTSTEFKLASNFQDAINSTFVTLPMFTANYKIKCLPAYLLSGAELAKWEPDHPAYPSRFTPKSIADLVAPTTLGNTLTMESFKVDISNNSGLPLTYNTIVLWTGGTATPKNATGEGLSVSPLETIVGGNAIPQSVTIAPQTSRRITYSLSETFDAVI